MIMMIQQFLQVCRVAGDSDASVTVAIMNSFDVGIEGMAAHLEAWVMLYSMTGSCYIAWLYSKDVI